MELEKWETKEWFVITEKIRPRGGGGKKYYRNRGLGYGNILLKVDKLIVGEFSLKYSDILKIGKHRKFPYMLISCADGVTYWFTCFSSSRNKYLDTAILKLKENLEKYEKIKISDAIEYVKDLPNLYKEISLDDLSSRTKLKRDELMDILEKLILKRELNAEIRGNLLNLKTSPISIPSPMGYDTNTTKGQIKREKKGIDLGHDVFICHSSKDKEIADATCHFLEQNGIKCWIAPRDVSTGSYAVSIVDAIETSKLLVIIFSNNSNVSDHVKNELEIAVSSGITIQPFRIEDVEPSTEMKYYIKRMHWLDALTPPLEDHLSKLTEMISKLLEVVSN